MESFITEVLATAEQTGGAFGIWRYVRQPGGGPGCLRYRQMFSTRFNSGARDGRKSKVMFLGAEMRGLCGLVHMVGFVPVVQGFCGAG